MAAHRRTISQLGALLSALLLAASLGACTQEGAPAPETPSADPPLPARTAPPQQVPTAEGESLEPTEAESMGAQLVGDGDPDGAGERGPLTATTITGVWPDATWTIHEMFEGDACAGRPPEISRYALGEDYFSCGDPADRLIACKHDVADHAFCVRDPLEKTAVFIRSPVIADFTAPAPEDPLPLMVILADGTTCSPVPRDDLEHHAGRQSWMYCGEDAALLLDLATASEYFDPSAPVWTADLGVGRAAPVEVPVREVIYAGTPMDVEAQGFTVG